MNLWYTCWLHQRDPHRVWNWGPTCRFVALPRGRCSPRSNECIKRIHNCSSLMCDRYNIPHFTSLFWDIMYEWAQWNRRKKKALHKPSRDGSFYGLCRPLWGGRGYILTVVTSGYIMARIQHEASVCLSKDRSYVMKTCAHRCKYFHISIKSLIRQGSTV